MKVQIFQTLKSLVTRITSKHMSYLIVTYILIECDARDFLIVGNFPMVITKMCVGLCT